MTLIAVVNKSTLVTDSDVQLMTAAVAHQIHYHVAPQWGFRNVPVVHYSSEAAAPSGSWVIAVLDDSDQADALGWHTEAQGDKIYGRVFARPVLDSGGNSLTNSLSVASVLSHEVIETYVDPHVNLWADDGNGTVYALEAGDPVESDSYPVVVTRSDGTTVAVMVSNFVTPHWFDPQAGAERFDFMRRVAGPFEMTSGGYVVTMTEGQVSQQFGELYPDWRKATKTVDVARSQRRK